MKRWVLYGLLLFSKSLLAQEKVKASFTTPIEQFQKVIKHFKSPAILDALLAEQVRCISESETRLKEIPKEKEKEKLEVEKFRRETEKNNQLLYKLANDTGLKNSNKDKLPEAVVIDFDKDLKERISELDRQAEVRQARIVDCKDKKKAIEDEKKAR